MEHNPQQPSSIKDALLRKISMDELVMRPRAYFTARIVAAVVVALMVLVISILIFNFLLFSIHASGRGMLLDFGPRGYVSFLQFFPWPLLLVDVALIALLQWLVRQFKFGYKSPLLYMLALLVVCTVSFGLLVERATGLNGVLVDQEQHGHLPPPLDSFYHYGSRPPSRGEGVCRCTITAITGNTITALDTDEGSSTPLSIVLPADDAHATTSGLSVGDLIFVVGDEHQGIIHAFGVRKTSGEDMDIHRPPPR